MLALNLSSPRSVTRCSAPSSRTQYALRSFSGMVGRNSHQLLLHGAQPTKLVKSKPIGRRACVTTKAMFERFTEKAIKVVMLAQEEARRLGHNFVRFEQSSPAFAAVSLDSVIPTRKIAPRSHAFRPFSHHSQVGTEQILLGLIGESTGT